MVKIAVIDGQGGGIGRAIVEKLRSEIPECRIIALGTNAVATGRTLKARLPNDGATGRERDCPQRTACRHHFCGAIGILNASSMMGELTPLMASAIGESEAFKVLLPINRCHIHVVSVNELPLGEHIANAVSVIRRYIQSPPA